MILKELLALNEAKEQEYETTQPWGFIDQDKNFINSEGGKLEGPQNEKELRASAKKYNVKIVDIEDNTNSPQNHGGATLVTIRGTKENIKIFLDNNYGYFDENDLEEV